MPIYEYECKKCGHQMEVFQMFSDPPLCKCEVCNGKVRKLISQNTFHLKGSGWYVTDYASKGSPPNGKKKESPSTEAKKTDTKPAKDTSTGSTTKSDK